LYLFFRERTIKKERGTFCDPLRIKKRNKEGAFFYGLNYDLVLLGGGIESMLPPADGRMIQ
jgi:hypothetical protein